MSTGHVGKTAERGVIRHKTNDKRLILIPAKELTRDATETTWCLVPNGGKGYGDSICRGTAKGIQSLIPC